MGGWGALWGSSPTPLERAGTEPSRAGPYFFEEIGERTPRGRRFLPLGTPFSGGRNGGRWLGRYGPGLRPPRPTPHGPPTSSGGREKWSVDGRRKWETKRLLSAFSQRAPTHVPSPPSRWAGRYGPFAVRAAGRVSRKKYSLPPHNPTREGSPEGRTSSLWGSFPHFFPRNGAPAGQALFPAVPTAPGDPHKPPRPGASRSRPFRQCRDKPPQTAKQRASPSGSPLSHSVMESPLRRWPGISPAGPVPP